MRSIVPVTLIIALVLAQFWMLRPLDDCDLYTFIVEGRAFPSLAVLTESEIVPGPSLSWLSGWTYAQVDFWRGLPGVKELHVVLMVGTYICLGLWQALVVRRLQGREPSLLGLGAGLSAAYIVSATNSNARTQDFTYVCLALLLVVLEYWSCRLPTSRAKWIRPALLVALLIVWQNSHPAVLLSLPIIAAYCLFRRLPWWYLSLPPIASVCTVSGVEIYSWAALNVEISRDLLHISEWQPAWSPSVSGAMGAFWFFAVALAFGMCISKVRRRMWDPTVASISLGFFLLTLTSARFGALWGFVSAPLLGELFCAFWPGTLASKSASSVRPRVSWIVALVALFALTQNPGPLLPKNSPLRLFQELKLRYPSARIFNYREFGGALEYVGYPDWQVYIDGRIYLFAPETWLRYEAISRAENQSLVDEVVHSHNLLILHRSYHRALIEKLRSTPSVRLIAEQSDAVVFESVHS
jgi:hypothetical protein